MRSIALRGAAAILLAAGVLVSAQQLPDEPAKGFGTGITGSFEGWFDNADGSHNFVLGYLNRNRAREVDVSIGPENRIEPGGPDMGQPTHFLPGRQTGLFTVTVPKEFRPDQRLTWTITVNGQTNSIPLHLVPDYLISPLQEASVHNTPPTLRLFAEQAPGIQGPIGRLSNAVAKTASVGVPLELPLWADDDARFTSPTSAPPPGSRPPVTLTWAQFRGPGAVTFDQPRPSLQAIKGGAVNVPYSGKATTLATFSMPGEYVLHVTANDYSGVGGNGFVCCWTTALVKVSVAP
jgi:hypothetical protein